MIFHENRLPADDFHEIYSEKQLKDIKILLTL